VYETSLASLPNLQTSESTSVHFLTSNCSTMLRCAISHSTPSSLHPSDLQYPYFGGTSKSFQCACRLSRSTKSDCSLHPPWVSQSRAPAPESAATGTWLLHHTSRLRNASRSGVHDSAVAFSCTNCFHVSFPHASFPHTCPGSCSCSRARSCSYVCCPHS